MRCLVIASLVLSWTLAADVALAQDSPKKKKPETAKTSDFDPTALNKLAVIVIGQGDRDGQNEQQRLVEDVFIESLIAKGHSVVARSDVDSVLKEKRFQESDMVEQMATSVGKLLNVEAMLVIRITEMTTDSPKSGAQIAKASLGARLISVENGSILWSGKNAQTTQLVGKHAPVGNLLKTATELAELFPEKSAERDMIAVKEIEPKLLPKIAVIVVGGRPPTRTNSKAAQRPETQTDHQRLVEDAFVNVLMQKGYGLVSRSDLQTVAKEQRFQQSGVTEDNAVALGKMLKVPAVLVVMITDSTYETRTDPASRRSVNLAHASVGARLVDVASGEIWWTHGEWLCRDNVQKTALTEILDKVAKDVAEFYPPFSDQKKTLYSQAERLEKVGQKTAAATYYRCVLKNFPDSEEGNKAKSKLSNLQPKKPA
jgi:hypothetical protein